MSLRACRANGGCSPSLLGKAVDQSTGGAGPKSITRRQVGQVALRVARPRRAGRCRVDGLGFTRLGGTHGSVPNSAAAARFAPEPVERAWTCTVRVLSA